MKKLNILFTASNPALFVPLLRELVAAGAHVWCTKGTKETLRIQFNLTKNIHPVWLLGGYPESIGGVKTGAVRSQVLSAIMTNGKKRSRAETQVFKDASIPDIHMVILDTYPLEKPKFIKDKPKIDLSPVLLEACYKFGNAIPITNPRDLALVHKALQSRRARTTLIPELLRDKLELKAAAYVARHKVQVLKIVRSQFKRKYRLPRAKRPARR